jgi:glucose/mannose-6-phosphate isomerase
MALNIKHNLDDPEVYTQLDPSGLRKRLQDLPRHCLAAWQQVRAAHLPDDWADSNKVVIGGMGGSAIAGDLVADLMAIQSSVPILVVREPRLPFYLTERTLFLACSYSGNTEETLALWDQAAKTDARIMAVSSGGTLAASAEEHQAPLLRVDVSLEPRSAVGYNLMLLLGVLKRLGLLRVGEAEVERTVQSLCQKISLLKEDVPATENPAKQLAAELRDKLILVYGSGLFRGVARRWKSQFNENSKAWSYFETIPEMLHNSVEAFRTSSPMAEWGMALLLQPNNVDGGHQRHHAVVAELLRRNNIPHRVLQGEPGPPLSQLLDMLSLGDYVSYYLALLQGVDPSPNPSIDEAKELLPNPPAQNPGMNLSG